MAHEKLKMHQNETWHDLKMVFIPSHETILGNVKQVYREYKNFNLIVMLEVNTKGSRLI